MKTIYKIQYFINDKPHFIKGKEFEVYDDALDYVKNNTKGNFKPKKCYKFRGRILTKEDIMENRSNAYKFIL